MSSSINLKKKSLNMDFVKRTAGIVTGGTTSYISEVMPISTSTLKEAKSAVSTVSSTLKNTSQDINSKIRSLKSHASVREIYNWYMDKEDEYDDNYDFGESLNLDIDTDASEIAEFEISESERNSNKIAKAVVESSHKQVESLITSTANIESTLDKQSAVINSGFEKTNDILSKILEVVTKNSATLIETTTAMGSSNNSDPATNMMRSGKFSMSEYKKIISGNIKKSPELAMLSMIPSMLGGMNIKDMITPEDIFKGLFGIAVNKKAPNFKKNMQALDDAISDTIMHSLIRLGNNRSFSIGGYLGKLFGIDSTRKTQSTARSTFEVKSVPFDTITKEAITNTIPGYLRKILVAVGGDDVVYDYRSRSFKTSKVIRKEYAEVATGYNNIYGASSKVRNAIGNNPSADMFYEMLLADLGSRENPSGTLNKFANKKSAKAYMKNDVLSGMNLTAAEKKNLNKFIDAMSSLTGSNNGIMDIMMQASKGNVSRNTRMAEYIRNADLYNIDLSKIIDSVNLDKEGIAERYGKKINNKSTATSIDPKIATGTTYTNIALYEIFRRLDKGINVFQVGSNNTEKKRFATMQKHLPPPIGYKVKPDINKDTSSNTGSPLYTTSGLSSEERGPNLLQNQEDENLSKGQRFGRWAKSRGGTLRRAIFDGSPEQVRAAFGNIIGDIGDVASDGFKQGISKINTSFGNVSGHLKHKMFGSAYSYKDENGKEVKVEKNEKGGILGYVDELIFGEGGAKGSLKNIKSRGSKWFKSVAGYFDYGDSNDPDEKKVVNKRKKLIATSVGAMIGGGLLGGPIGLLMGGIAGNAMSQTDGIGDKIQKLLFGDKDHEGDDKKDRDKRRGLIHKAVDNIVDPIRFQIGKTMTSFASVLKKNILGPLSNIGYAIKDRMAEAAGGVVSKTFGKIFGGAFGLLKKVIMLPLNIAKAPITAIGNLGRVGAEAGGAVVGGGLNSIAKSIAGKHGKDAIKQRIAQQKHDAFIDRAESGFYGDYEFDYEQDPNGPRGKTIKTAKKVSKGRGYKAWKEAEDKRRDQMKPIEEYTKETVKNTSTIAEKTENLDKFIDEGLTKGSIFTHDQGLHDRLDNIIGIIEGIGNSDKRSRKLLRNYGSGVSESDNFASSALTAAASFAGSGDEVSNEESRLYNNIVDEAAKSNSSKSSITQKLKDMMGIQKKKSDEANSEKKQSIFTTIKDNIKGLFNLLPKSIGGAVAASLAGVIGFNDLKSFYDNVIKGDMDFSQWWGEKSKIGSAIQGLKDVSAFIGTAGAPIVNAASGAIRTVTKMVPFLPDLNPPNINPSGAFAGLQVAALGGLYLKSASAIGSIASAAASLLKGGSSGGKVPDILDNLILNKNGGKLSKWLKGGAIAATLYSYLKGPETHENTDAAGNEIVDKDKTRAIRNTGEEILVRDGIKTASKYAQGAAGRQVTRQLTDAGITATVNSAGKVTYRQAGKFAKNSAIEAATGVTRKTASDAITKAATSSVDNVTSSSKVVGFIKKALNGVKNFLMKNKHFSKFSKVIASKFDDIILKLGKSADGLIKKMPSKVAKIITKGGTKEAAAIATAGIGYAVMAFGGALSGGLSAANIFGVREADVNGTMRTVASVVVAMLNSVPGLWALELVDLIIAPDTFRGWLCSFLYELLDNDGAAELSKKQDTFNEDLNAYNTKYGTNLTADEYNDLVNKGAGSKIFGKGAVKTDADGRAMFADDGSVLRTNHGISGWFSKDKSKISTSNAPAYAAISTAGSVNSLITDPLVTTNSAITEWEKSDVEIGKDGKPLLDLNGKPIKKGELGKYIVDSIGLVNSSLVDPINTYNKNRIDLSRSPYKSNYRYSLGGEGIGGPVDDVMSFKYMPQSSKDILNTNLNNASVDDHLKNMPTSFMYGKPDTHLNNISDFMLSEKSTAKKYSSNVFNVNSLASNSNTSSSSEGGNPLNKPYKITSNYGNRTMNGKTEFHSGIDIVPTDHSGEATVNSRYNGVINWAGYDPSGGNMVNIDTDSGLRIKNMHMKSGSIPSNIKTGARVKVGDKLGDMGSTGNSTGPHLHYQIEKSPFGKLNSINPMTSIAGMSSLSNSNSSESSNYSTSDGYNSYNNPEKKSGFMGLIDSLKNLGSKFLGAVTGGLLGSSNMMNPKDELAFNMSASGNQGSPTGSWGTCSSSQDFLSMCAKEIGVTENPPNSNKTKYGEWYKLNGEPWCMIFVQWCFNQAGLKLPYKSASCSDTLGWWRRNYPGRVTDIPKQGDIVIYNFGHTGIVESYDGKNITAIEGNTSPGNKGSQDNGGTVARRTRSMSSVNKFIHPVDFEALSAKSTISSGPNNGILGNGQGLVVPQRYGTAVTYEKEILKDKYDSPTHGWASSSNQGQMRKDAISKGRIKPMNMYGLNNVATIDGRALIATPYPKIGNQLPVKIGDHLDVKFDDGSIWNTMLGDTKNPSDPGMTVWGHGNGKNTVELIYWDYKQNPKNVNKKVQTIVKTGKNYYDGIGGPSDDIKPKYQNKNVEGIGGPVEEHAISNNISTSTYIPKTPTIANVESINRNISNQPKPNPIKSSTYRTITNLSKSDNNYQTIPTSGSDDNEQMLKLLTEVLIELRSITKNTGSSSDLLADLNEKDFVDQGLRNSINSLGGRRSKSSTGATSAALRTNTRIVNTLSRP